MDELTPDQFSARMRFSKANGRLKFSDIAQELDKDEVYVAAMYARGA